MKTTGGMNGFGKAWGRSVAAAVLLLGATAQARDSWLEADPAPVPPARAEERALHLRVGEGFVAQEERPLAKEAIHRFDLYAEGARRRDLLAAGQAGQMPVAKLPTTLGSCLVVLDQKEREVTTGHEQFNRFLAEEGQEAVLAQRAKAGQTEADGHEVRTRYLKALVRGTDPSSTLPNTFYKRRVGQRLEILLQNNPGKLPASRKLTVKVLFEGKPLAGAKVFALHHEAGGATAPPNGEPVPPLTATTSPQGLAEFKLEQNGPWLVRLTHVRAAPERKGSSDAVWESFWGSYSFAARVATPPPATGAANPPGSSSPGEDKK